MLKSSINKCARVVHSCCVIMLCAHAVHSCRALLTCCALLLRTPGAHSFFALLLRGSPNQRLAGRALWFWPPGCSEGISMSNHWTSISMGEELNQRGPGCLEVESMSNNWAPICFCCWGRCSMFLADHPSHNISALLGLKKL